MNLGGLFNRNQDVPFVGAFQGGLFTPDANQSPFNVAKDEDLNKRMKRIRDKFEVESELEPFIAMKSVISMLSLERQNKMAILTIKSDNLEGQSSVNDPKLGSNDEAKRGFNSRCDYCGLNRCPGHCAIIKFPEPVFNPVIIRNIVRLLVTHCNACGAPLISDDVMREKGFNLLPTQKRLKEMELYCKSGIHCLRPRDGITKPCTLNPEYISSSAKTEGIIEYRVSNKGNKKNLAVEVRQQKTAKDALRILSSIPDESVRKLGIGLDQHPRDYILSAILVPPPNTRPPLYESDNIRPNPITMALINLYKTTQNRNRNSTIYKDLYALIYGNPTKKKGNSNQQYIIGMIQGKKALIRSYFMGKKVNNSARTVASPDDMLNFGEIGIPRVWAGKLTKRVRITSFNIEYLYSLLKKGHLTHYISKTTNIRQALKDITDFKLRIGDQVDRFLEDGDIICVNRQPTLHKYSLHACTVRLGDHKTINLHLAYTPGMNCDFDGDECNLWVVQDEEAEVELWEMINIKKNIISSENNKPIVTLVLNSILGSYLLTDTRTFIEENTFQALINIISSREDLETLNERLTMNGVNKRSGRALFSALLPHDFFYSFGNFHIFNGVVLNPSSDDPNEARIVKKILSTADGSIIHAMYKQYGSERVSRFLTDTPKVINRWLMERGFSVGIKDCISIGIDENGLEYDKNKRLMESIIADTDIILRELGGKLNDELEESFRKQLINEAVDRASGAGLVIAKNSFDIDNAYRIMTDEGSGAKGGIANVGQISGLVGQQFIAGNRPEPILRGNRLNISRDKNDLSAEGNAFIPRSFESGLTPTDLQNLMAGGRPGLLDTSMGTSVAGTISKKMSKAQENIIIYSDFTVRNTNGSLFLVSFNCGYRTDAVVQVKAEGRTHQTNFINISSLVNEINGKRGFIKKDVIPGIEKGVKDNKTSEKEDSILGRNPDIKSFKPYIAKNPYVEKKYDNINNRIDKYERTRIIGARTMQLTFNAPPKIDNSKYGYIKAMDIARKEFDEGLIDIFSIRSYSNNDYEIVYPTLDNIN